MVELVQVEVGGRAFTFSFTAGKKYKGEFDTNGDEGGPGVKLLQKTGNVSRYSATTLSIQDHHETMCIDRN